MRFILLSLFLVSFSAFANDIIKLNDGSGAVCKTKADVLRYQAGTIYRPLSFVRGNDIAEVTLEFLRCVQKGEKFFFVRDSEVEHRTIKIDAGPFSREDQTYSVERSEISAVVFSSRGRVYSRSELKQNRDHTWTQKIPVESANFEVNRNGEYFFEFAVNYKMMVKDAVTGKVIDSKLEWLGSYRVYVR